MNTYFAMMRPDGSHEATEERTSGNDRDYLQDMFGAPETSSGVRMGPRDSLTIAAVWQAVTMLSGSVAQLPLVLFEREEGQRTGTPQLTNPSSQVVNLRANPYMAAFEFWRRMMTHALIWNYGYALIERDAVGNPIGLWPLLPDRTYPYVVDLDGNQTGADGQALMERGTRLTYVSEVGGQVYHFDHTDILALSGITIDTINRNMLVDYARDSWALSIAGQDFTSKFFANGANSGGILELPYGMKKTAIDNISEGFYRAHTGVSNAFKTVILRDGAKFHNTQVNPNESQLTEGREEQVREIARWFNIPPHRLGVADSASSAKSIAEDNRRYLESSLAPWLKTIQSQCWAKLLDQDRQDGSWYYRHDVRELLQADSVGLADVIGAYLERGVINPNEARAWLNLDSRPGGDEYYYSNNMQPESLVLEGDPVDPPTELDVTPDPDENQDQDEAEMSRCLYCDSEFRSKQNQLYCAPACRQAAYLKRRKTQKTEESES